MFKFNNDRRIIKKREKIADKIIQLSEKKEIYLLKNEEFKIKTLEFKKRILNGENLNNLLIESFALVREAIRRIMNLYIYKVQIIGAIVLHEGDVAEMKTGEGKTLTALMPAYLNSLNEKSVHIITVNEYLSKRDYENNSLILNLLGITVGLNLGILNKFEKKNEYLKDIIYTTNSELGFDYLRDNMVNNFEDKVQRGLNYAIIDEADSILIDESRTPLIISGGLKNRTPKYKLVDKFVKSLVKKDDLIIDLETKQVYLTKSGIEKAEKNFFINSLFDIENTELYHLILNSLKANFVFKNGIEYVVQKNEIILIDQFTGRLMYGRAYSDGLQQSLQAKENVEIEQETITLGTITYQNFFRLYNKLSGMTGTAKTEEEEFIKIYNMRVIQIPTNKPIIRVDQSDFMFANKIAKMNSMIKEIININKKGQPILIGTTSVESSEVVSFYLKKFNLKFEMLNAKNHKREAEIIANAGKKKSITLATNMAGRGTDIKLDKDVIELGGLVVFGVERNEARRIDNQLRGRSGRQGDPGFSRFYVAMDDELMIRFGSEKLKKIFNRLGEDFIKSKMLTKAISNAQKKVEGINFDQRKNVLDYDNVLAQHREVIYSYRDEILLANDLKLFIKKMFLSVSSDLINIFSNNIHGEKIIDFDKLINNIHNKIILKDLLNLSIMKKMNFNDLSKYLSDNIFNFYNNKILIIPNNSIIKIEKKIIISAFDEHWVKHIDRANKLRSGIYLRSYAQTNPLHAYIEESSKLYNYMKISISYDVIINLFKFFNNIGDLKNIDLDNIEKNYSFNSESAKDFFNY